MNQMWLGLMTIGFLVLVGFTIYVLLEVRRFLKTTEDSLKPTLEELRETLKSLRKVTDDVGVVTEDVKLVSGSIKDIGEDVRSVSDLVSEVSSDSIIKVSAMRVGIRTALEVLIKNLLVKGGNQ